MDSVLRPRDIQARIRSGESPESVAAVAQTSVDRIMVFASPVLAERAYVAQQALKASVRRRAADGPIGQLGAAVAERLEASDLDPESVEWDAWRREDGRWTLVADIPAGSSTQRAQFVFDMAGRYVVADDDESRRLVGERTGAPAEPVAADPVRRLAAVLDSPVPERPTPDEQLPLGDDAIELVTGRRPEPVVEEKSDDWMVTQASDRPEPADEPVDALFAADDLAPAEAEPEPDAGADPEPEAKQPKKPTRSRGRSSVPSWDEIMFGSGRGE